MNAVKIYRHEGIAILTLNQGSVNALNDELLDRLHQALVSLERDPDVKAVILTGAGKFFSFGFDIPHFLSCSKGTFKNYVTRFTDVCTSLFLYPKPVVAALNGHTFAGGCILALACDARVMAVGKVKIALNEITFGSTFLAGSTEMLRFQVGNRMAAKMLYSGESYSAEEAMAMGLIDDVASTEKLMDRATEMALNLGEKPGPAFAGIKSLLRNPVANKMKRMEKESINAFVDIWYSESVQENLKTIKIR